MGFEVPSTGSVLTFKGTKYEGLEVTVDEAPVGLLLKIMKNYSHLADKQQVDPVDAMKALEALAEGFGGVLESWNAEKKGVPVPATAEGLLSLGAAFVLAVIGAWITGKVGVDEELGKDSPSGETSPEVLTAAAALSKSLPSS